MLTNIPFISYKHTYNVYLFSRLWLHVRPKLPLYMCVCVRGCACFVLSKLQHIGRNAYRKKAIAHFFSRFSKRLYNLEIHAFKFMAIVT